MTPSLIFIHYLKRLDKLLVKVSDFYASEELLHARLSGDMFPLAQQAKVAIGFSLRTCCPLAGIDIISYEEEGNSLQQLRTQIAKTIDYLHSIPQANFENYAEREINTRAGFADHTMDGNTYFLMYALPNFFFHFTSVYAIGRKHGVPLGKGDFDGFHSYPENFSFQD